MIASNRILITRSQPGAERLGRTLQQAGFCPLVSPLIGIEPYQDVSCSCLVSRLHEFDVVLCLSTHSVDFASDLLQTLVGAQENKSPVLMAIGRATRASLEALGLQVSDASPECGSDASSAARESSEALLASTALAQPKDRRILIISGVGGRTLLTDTLQQRGAEVVNMRVYQRTILPWSKAQADSAVTADAVILSSGEAVTAFDREWSRLGASRKVALIVPNQRIRSIAQELGFTRVLSSQDPGDDAVLKKLKKVFNE